MATRRAAAAKPAPEPEVDEFEEMEDMEDDEETTVESEDDDLDDLEEIEDDESDVKPTKSKATKAKATSVAKKSTIEFGSPWLAEHITEVTGEKFDARGIRMLLRKLAADGKLKREVGVTRERYNFSGPDDATVKSVVAMVKDGTAKQLKQAGLEKVKADAAAKKAAKRAQQAEEAEDADDEEVEEAPKPRRSTRAKTTATAAPAKATASTTRRRAAAAK